MTNIQFTELKTNKMKTKKIYPAKNSLKVYHVYSGLDAFVIHKDGKDIYLPYIVIIAGSEQEAKELAAISINQKLEDQDTNSDYENYVDWAEFKYNF